MIRSFRGALSLVVLAVAAAASAGTAQAQVFTLPFMAPQSDNSVGAYLSDYGDLAVEGIARSNFGGFTLGIRGGIVDAGEATGISVGGELLSPLELGADPLDIAFTAGIQGLFGDFDGIGVQGGLSVGHSFLAESGILRFTPYIHPRIAFIDPGEQADGNLEVLADIGFNLDFTSRLSLRFGANIGDGADWGIGVALRQ